MKILGFIIPLFIAAILASAKAIVDVEVLKSENISIKSLLISAQEERKTIRGDIKRILEKL